MVVWGRFVVVWIHYLVAWTLLHDFLVKAPGCLESVPGALKLAPWLSVEGSCLPGFSSWLPGRCYMVVW